MIDDHAHPFPTEFAPLRPAAVSLDVDAEVGAERRRATLGPGRLWQHLLTNRLAALLQVAPEDAVVARDEEAARDWAGWVRRLFTDAGVHGIILDRGVAPSSSPITDEPVDVYATLCGRPTWDLVRIDPIVDHLMSVGADAQTIIDSVRDEVAAALAHGAVGVKTILAYRTGLAVDPQVTLAQAQRSLAADEPVRRRGKALRDLVFTTVLALAVDLDVPVQVHTGFGDSEIRLRDSDPTLLEELLHSPVGRAARLVLIHGSFPWIDAVAYLAASRANVYAELSLSNLFAPAHTADRLQRLLDLAPRDRVLMGTDGHGPPETHWFAAAVLQDAWRQARGRLAAAGAAAAWLDDTREAVFTANARSVYRLT